MHLYKGRGVDRLRSWSSMLNDEPVVRLFIKRHSALKPVHSDAATVVAAIRPHAVDNISTTATELVAPCAAQLAMAVCTASKAWLRGIFFSAGSSVAGLGAAGAPEGSAGAGACANTEPAVMTPATNTRAKSASLGPPKKSC
jgi:hypothetical protein